VSSLLGHVSSHLDEAARADEQSVTNTEDRRPRGRALLDAAKHLLAGGTTFRFSRTPIREATVAESIAEIIWRVLEYRA
jgi:hypothetical protein